VEVKHEQLGRGTLTDRTLTRSDEEREDDREQEKVVRMREHPEAGREPDRRDQHDVARAVAVEEVAEQRSEEGSDDIDAGENQGQLGARDVESDDLLARENPRRVQ